MRLVITGLLTDFNNRILLQKVTDESLAPIGRFIGPGATPAQVLDRAFREETGLIVMPVRLAGIYFSSRDDRLTFCYRCTMRGGDLRLPEGRPPAGFFDSTPLPRGLSPVYRQLIDGALYHPGGPPLLEREATGIAARLSRLLGRTDTAPEAVNWEVTVRTAEGAGDMPVAWAIAESTTGRSLPLGRGEAPWEAAARLSGAARPARVVGVEVAAERPAMTLLFAPAG